MSDTLGPASAAAEGREAEVREPRSKRRTNEAEPIKIDFAIGGQALIEGVMMRSPHYVTAAIRKHDGTIKLKKKPFTSLTYKYRLLKLPILRGIINLFEMIVIGMQMVNFSAEEFVEEDQKDETHKNKETGGEKSILFQFFSMALSLILSFALALFLFKFIPLSLTEWLRTHVPFIADYYVAFNLIEGALRIGIFLLYIFVLSRFKSFHRIFEYHGAEHMAVHAYEKGKELTVEHVRPEHPEHPRCGTSFLLAVFIVSIIVYSLLPRNPDFAANLTQRILVIPLIAGIGYEVLKWSAKYRDRRFMNLVTAPGMLTQKITTQRPDEKQIEVAIAALKLALELEKNSMLRRAQHDIKMSP